jgi:hypothetical protein
MEKTKAVMPLIVASVLVAAVAGIAFAQFAVAQTAGYPTNQIQQGASGAYYPSAQQGYYPYGSGQYGYPNGYGMGMGMCGRW